MKHLRETSLKKNRGGVAQAVEHLICKCEDLCSNPSATKKIKTTTTKTKSYRAVALLFRVSPVTLDSRSLGGRLIVLY
jgi:hypothetical protein